MTVLERLDTLERRIADLEARPTLRYLGVYADSHHDYREGDVVTWSGSMWVARRSGPLATPGSDPGAWTLAVKRGKDAR